MSRLNLRAFVAGCVVVALLAWIGTASLYAAQNEKGSVSGQVLMADGKPASSLALRLDQHQPLGMDKGGRRGVMFDDSGAVGLAQGMKTMARTTTDKDGKFSFKNLTPGAYIMVGGSKNIGWIYYPVEVEAGKDVALGEIKLHKE